MWECGPSLKKTDELIKWLSRINEQNEIVNKYIQTWHGRKAFHFDTKLNNEIKIIFSMDDKKKENWIAIQKTLYPQNKDEKIRII